MLLRHTMLALLVCAWLSLAQGMQPLQKHREYYDPVGMEPKNANFPVVQLGLFASPEYVDLAKNGPRWQQVTGPSLATDPLGWPQQDFEWIIDFRRNKPWSGPDFNGVDDNDHAGAYFLSFLGQANFSSTGEPNSISFENQTYNSATGMTTLNVVLQPGHWLYVFQFLNTQRPGQAVGSGLTNISLLLPGYAPGNNQWFTNEFVNIVKQMKPTDFRSFDTGINGYNIWYGTNLIVNTWADRSLPSDAYWPLQARNQGNVSGLSMPWEIFMQICIQTNTPGWFSLPVGADDEYITNFAQLLKNGNQFTAPYPSGMPFYIEYSNEVWNWGFSQSIYNEVMAKQNNVSALQNYVNRLCQISAIFRQVWGDAAMGTIVRPLVLWQYNNWSPVQDALNVAQQTFKNPVDYYVWGIGEAPYVNPLENGQVIYSENLDPTGVNRIMDTFYTSAGQRRQAFTSWQSVATFFGINIVGYESGPSLVAGIEGEVSRSPRMKDFVQRYYMENWFAVGGAAVNYFALGPGSPGAFGDWYLFEHWDNYNESGKFQGYLAVSGQQYPPLTVGYVLGWNANQQIVIDASQYQNPWAWANIKAGSSVAVCATGCWPHPDQINYLLRASATGTYSLMLSGTASTSTTTLDIWLDNALLERAQLPTGTAGNVTIGFKIAETGLHTLALSTETAGNVQLTGQSIWITMQSGSGTASTPSAPLNVFGSATDSGASLAWEPVSTATGYTVQRSTTSGGPYTTVSSPTTNSFADTGLTNDVLYHYVVYASNSAGNSALSPQIALHPTQQVAPLAPQVTISAGYQNGGSIEQLGQAFLQWAAVPNAQSYTVNRFTSAAGAGKTTFGPYTGLSLYDTNLTPGSTYYYNVTASNTIGSSTTAVSVAIPTTSTPGTPTNLNVTNINGVPFLQWTQAMWSFPEFAELFIVERATSETGTFTAVNAVSVNSYFDVYADGTKYCYRVWGNSGSGGQSAQPSNVACSA